MTSPKGQGKMNGQYEIGRFISEGWSAFRQNMAPMVVSFIVYVGVLMAANLVPFFGGLVSFAITGPMLGGLLALALKVVDGEEPSWNGIFDGFQKFMPLFLANLMITIFTFIPVFAVVIPGVLFLGLGGMMTAGMDMEGNQEMAAGAGAALGGGILLLVFVAMLAYMVIYSWYLYTYFFIMEEDDDFWPAMEKSRKIWFAQPVPSTLFVLAIGVISMSGFILLGVGALITVPLGFCAMAVAYRNVANAGTAPPPALGSVAPSRPSPPPPPATTDRFDNIPAQSGDTLVIPLSPRGNRPSSIASSSSRRPTSATASPPRS